MATVKVINDDKLIIEKLEVFNDDKLLLVSLNQSFKSNLNDDELYEITRGNWFHVKEEIAKNTDYILGIYKKKVRSVIKKEEYEFIGNRCRFTGELIKNSLYLGKTTDDYKMQQNGWLYEPNAIKQKSTFIENVDVENVVDLNQYTEVIEKYDKTKFLEEVFIEENDFETIKALLERKKNIILQGAPGVGKTFAAKRIAYSMIGEKDENLIKIVQFHQNYSYEDFVEGYKPNEDGGFELEDGVFKKFCEEALKNLEECNKSEDEKSFEKKFEKAYNKLIEDIDENNVKIESKNKIVYNNIEITPNNNLKIIREKGFLHVSYNDLLKVAKKFKPQQKFSTTDIKTILEKGRHTSGYWAVLNHIYNNYWSEDNIKETKPTETIEKKKYFFIIDEINRGNLSKIFGELLMLIEDTHRGEKINLAYSGEEFCVPENVYIIGMMNTADRSLAMIDYALRRRFSFFEMQPAFENEKFREIIKGENLKKVVEKIIELNKEICKDASLGKGFCIGHSYFCNLTDDNEETLKKIINYEIAPMLKEYWFDDIKKYDEAIKLLKNDNLQEHSN